MSPFEERYCTVTEPTNPATYYVNEIYLSGKDKTYRLSKHQKKAWVTLLTSNRRDLEAKSAIWDKENQYIYKINNSPRSYFAKKQSFVYKTYLKTLIHPSEK